MKNLKNLNPAVTPAALRKMSHGTVVVLAQLPALWLRIIPDHRGIMVQHSVPDSVGEDAITYISLNGVAAHWKNRKKVENTTNVLPPYKYVFPAHINRNTEQFPCLNSDPELPVRFNYEQFEGHPFGAIFCTQENEIKLIIDRSKFDKKFKTSVI